MRLLRGRGLLQACIGVTLANFRPGKQETGLGDFDLEAMAFQIGGEKLIVPVIDARGRRLYYGAYRHKAEGPICVLKDDLRTVDALAEYLAESDEEVILCGDIVSKYASELSVQRSPLRNLIEITVSHEVLQCWEHGDGIKPGRRRVSARSSLFKKISSADGV